MNFSAGVTPRCWVTHNTAVSEEKLAEIDMIPKIRNRHFLTPELAPIFTSDEKELNETVGTMCRLADGHGLATDTGAWGHRSYGDTMFVWTGAAVDIPYKVYKMLAGLGPKIYFFRLPYKDKTQDKILEGMRGSFNKKIANIQPVLYEYLAWFEIGPTLIRNEQNDLSKMEWDREKDDEQALIWIAKIVRVLSRLRCSAQVWNPKNQDLDYGFRHSDPEALDRPAEVLSNLARGHALLEGWNYITLADIPIVIKTALSTGIIDKVSTLYLLLEKNGTLVASEIEDALRKSKHIALNNMHELWTVGLVEMIDDTTNRFMKRIVLEKEFQWLLEQDFKKLLGDFKPINYRPFMNDVKQEEDKSKNPFSIVDISIFWRIFRELEDIERCSNPGMKVDKTTISEEKLHDALVSESKFTQSASMIIKTMKDEGLIEQVSWGTLRKKVD